MKNKLTRYMPPLRGWWSRQSLRRKFFYAVIVAVILLIAFKKSGDDGTATIEVVRRQNLVRSISASGSVVSSTDLSLGFEQSKMVASIKVSVGTKVRRGDVLANLSNGTERAAVASAKGALLAARARYNKVIEGSSNEEIKVDEINLANARRKLYSDDLVAEPQDQNMRANPLISGVYGGIIEGEYRISFKDYAMSEIRINGLEKGLGEVDETAKPLGTKGLRVTFPDDDYDPDNSWKVMIPNKSGEHYTENLNAYQAAQAELELTRATAQQPDVDMALADMVTAQAGVDSAIAALEHTILRAPAEGTITAVDVKIGEIATVGKQAIALQDVSNLYLEANVNESSIKSVALGQQVSVTFDAFTGDTYRATVSSIDPAATIENNVVNYKIKALLTETDGIRPGMTANMTVTTASIDNVLVLPGRVITVKDGKSTVDRITDERKQKTVIQEITTGLKGDGDMVEILSGLGEGDRVLWTVSAATN